MRDDVDIIIVLINGEFMKQIIGIFFAITLFISQFNLACASDGVPYRKIKSMMEFVDSYGRFLEKSTDSDLIYLGARIVDRHANGLVSIMLTFMPQGAAYEPKDTQEEREKLTERWGKKFCRKSFRKQLRENGMLIASGAIEIKGKRVSTSLCPALSD